jgi:hypothetical protein
VCSPFKDAITPRRDTGIGVIACNDRGDVRTEAINLLRTRECVVFQCYRMARATVVLTPYGCTTIWRSSQNEAVIYDLVT